MIGILVAEHLPLVRRGLVATLENENDMEVVADVSTGEDVLPAVLRHTPETAVIGLGLPDVCGFTTALRLHEEAPGCRVLLLSRDPSPGQVRRAFAAHALGFMSLEVGPEQLADGVRQVAAGRRAVDSELAVAALRSAENPRPAGSSTCSGWSRGGPGPARSPTSCSSPWERSATTCRESCARPRRATVSTPYASPATPGGSDRQKSRAVHGWL